MAMRFASPYNAITSDDHESTSNCITNWINKARMPEHTYEIAWNKIELTWNGHDMPSNERDISLNSSDMTAVVTQVALTCVEIQAIPMWFNDNEMTSGYCEFTSNNNKKKQLVLKIAIHANDMSVDGNEMYADGNSFIVHESQFEEHSLSYK